MHGFSIARMRAAFGSGDRTAVDRIAGRLTVEHPYWSPGERDRACGVVERAVMKGIPFDDVEAEDSLHFAVACTFAADGQEHRPTEASVYGAEALEKGLLPRARKLGRPEARAFVRGLVEDLPLFGRRFEEDGEVYAAIGLAKLRAFRPALADLRDQIAYRSGENHEAAEFAAEFCRWIDEIADAELDLWYATG